MVEFLHPTEGTLKQFETEYLRVFSGRQWRGKKLTIRNDVREAYNKAEDIADVLITGNEIRVEFELSPEQTGWLDRSKARPTFITISVHGSEYTYDQGGLIDPPTEVFWPGYPEEARIELETEQGRITPWKKPANGLGLG